LVIAHKYVFCSERQVDHTSPIYYVKSIAAWNGITLRMAEVFVLIRTMPNSIPHQARLS